MSHVNSLYLVICYLWVNYELVLWLTCLFPIFMYFVISLCIMYVLCIICIHLINSLCPTLYFKNEDCPSTPACPVERGWAQPPTPGDIFPLFPFFLPLLSPVKCSVPLDSEFLKNWTFQWRSPFSLSLSLFPLCLIFSYSPYYVSIIIHLCNLFHLMCSSHNMYLSYVILILLNLILIILHIL